jgi:hypothetical protein
MAATARMIDAGPLFLAYRRPQEPERKDFTVGVVLGNRRPPHWTATLLEWMRSVPWLAVRPFVLAAEGTTAPPWLAERLYAKSQKEFDPFGETGPGEGSGAMVLDDAARELPGAGCDLLVWLSEGERPAKPCAEMARYGVVCVQLGEGPVEPPYWGEAVRGETVSNASLWWHESSFARGRRLRVAEVKTEMSLQFTVNARECLTAVCRMITGEAADLAADTARWLERSRGIREEDAPTPARRAWPSNGAAVSFLLRQVRRSALSRLERRGREMRWFTSVRRRPEAHYAALGRFERKGFEELPIPRGSEMADPFVVEAAGKTWLFFEEVPAGTRKGRLSCLEIGEEPGKFSRPFVVMQQDFHLSYPCVFQHAREYFMIPESAGGRTVGLYRARRFPEEWRLETTLLEGVEVTDTTPFFDGERWYFFTTTRQPFLETFLFVSDRLDGEWRLHPASPVSSSVRSCRSAGRLFRQSGRLLRPAQDCSVRYGYAMTINEVTRLTANEFEERAVDRILPDWSNGLLGTHTLNSCGGIEVIDGLRYHR